MFFFKLLGPVLYLLCNVLACYLNKSLSSTFVDN